jgi:hypothetical protein
MTVSLKQDLIIFTDAAFLHLCVSSVQNNRHWNSLNPRLHLQVPLHDENFGVWCTVTAIQIVIHSYFLVFPPGT